MPPELLAIPSLRDSWRRDRRIHNCDENRLQTRKVWSIGLTLLPLLRVVLKTVRRCKIPQRTSMNTRSAKTARRFEAVIAATGFRLTDRRTKRR